MKNPASVGGLRLAWIVWSIVLLLLLSAFIPAAWFITLRIAGVHLSSTTADPLSFLTSLAGIMSAVFVVGGLVIALAAVLTVLAVEDRVKRSFNALLPQFVEQADRQIEAYKTFHDIRLAPDWIEQLRLGKQAIAEHNGLRRKVNAFLAVELSQKLLTAFAYAHTRLAQGYPMPMLNLPAPGVVLQQIWEAKASDADGPGELAAFEALMYGYLGQYERMLDFISRGRDKYPRLLEQLRPSARLALLAYAVGQDRERLADLGTVLDRTLPASRESVLQSINEIDLSTSTAAGSAHVDWIVLGKRPHWNGSDGTLFPKGLSILASASAPGERSCTVHLTPHFPSDPHYDLFTTHHPYTPEEVLDRMWDLFLFVCPDRTRITAPIPGRPETVTD
jgi:hypothetical protein